MEPLEDSRNACLFINPNLKIAEFKAYKLAQKSFWVEEEVDRELKKDSEKWVKFDPKIQDLIIHQIAFFVIADGKVNEFIANHIDSRITDREVQTWYNFQKMMEDIHNITYVKLADTYCRSEYEKKKVFDAVANYPVIAKKIAWLEKWIGKNNDFHLLNSETLEVLREVKKAYLNFRQAAHDSFSAGKNRSAEEEKILQTLQKLDEPRPLLAKQILINLIMEGLFFQGSFAIIFWINHQYHGALPGLAKANEFISRDEGTHTDFGIGLYNRRIKNRLPQTLVHQIMGEAVEIEIEFMREALPEGLLNMNIRLMSEYIKFVADKLLIELHYEKIFHAKNPFKFMEKQSVSVRITDFFVDVNVSEYGHHASGITQDDDIFGSDSDDD